MKTAALLGGLALVGATALSNVGCVAHGQAGGYVEAEAPVVFVEPPTLIEIDSDVWVVRDYDYPVYYVGDAYWVYRDNVWYRSDTYDGGWARIDVNIVPAVVAHRDHSAYVHYRGAATARTRVGPRGSEMRPASFDRRPGSVSEPRRGPPERAVEPRRGGPPERAVEPRRAPPERVVEPRRAPPERVVEPRRAPPERVVEPRRAPPERAVEPRRAPPERAVEPRRAPSGHAVEPPRSPAQRGPDQSRQGNDRGQKKATQKNKR